jgi:hypothetical protein
MSSVVISGNTSGTITLDAPAVAGTTTLTLPATSGTVVTKDTNGIASVNGIQFPATQSASANANTLDDYEEGTWTPGGNVVSLFNPTGVYTKVGNVVHVNGQWAYPINSDANTATISGLPFTSASGDFNFAGTTTATNYGSDDLYPFVNAGTNQVLIRNNVNSNLTNTNLSGRFITFMATYRVA